MLRKTSLLLFSTSLIVFAACSDDGDTGDDTDAGVTPDAALSDAMLSDAMLSDAMAPDAMAPDAMLPPAMVTVTAPNGGELLMQDTAFEITWTSMDHMDSVNIELYRGGIKDSDIALGEADDGSYTWTVPLAQAYGTDYRVRVSSAADPTVFDESDADFAIDDRTIIVTSPVGGAEVIAGNIMPITWTFTGIIDTVDIEVYRAGASDSILIENLTNTGSYDWPVATDRADAADYTILVKDSTGPAMDESDASFTVRNWTTRSPVVISTPELRSSFPVAVELDPATFNYALAAADGSDVRFATTSDRSNGFDLSYYIEVWEPTGTSIIWVNMPTLDPMTPATIYMFYGFSGATSTSDMAATFPNSFVSVGMDFINGDVSYDMFTVQAGHTVTITDNAPSTIAARIINIEGTIEGTGAGHPGGGFSQAGFGPGGGGTSANSGAGGGGYGGDGGRGGFDAGDTPGAGGTTYGDSGTPTIEMGSGGGGSTADAGGRGGGAITLVGRRINISGSILADGTPGSDTVDLRSSGGGSGGGILILGYDLTLSGLFSARGGAGGEDSNVNADDGGGGGGGRIKFFSERSVDDTATVDVAAGVGGPNGSVAGGQDGIAGEPSADPMAISGEPSYALMPEEPVFVP